MLSEYKNCINKNNLDEFLKALGKEFRRLTKSKAKAELILVGGASVIINYGFREMTTDIDAVIEASSAMKDAINIIGNKYNLPYGWLNSDFMKTGSYSSKINEYSVYYRTFSNVLEVRTISAEYLIAMKLRAGREYKNDLSDIVGILNYHEKINQPISLQMIETAVINLYGSWNTIPDESKDFINDVIRKGNYEVRYSIVNEKEKRVRELLVEFDEKYPKATKETNVKDILNTLLKRMNDADN